MRIPAIIKDISSSTRRNHNSAESGVNHNTTFINRNTPHIIDSAKAGRSSILDSINGILGIILGVKPQPIPVRVEPQRFSKLG